MEIKSINYPSIELISVGGTILNLNVIDFLNYTVPEKQSPYRRILESEIFSEAYILGSKLIWPKALIATVCSGDTQFHDAEFSETEILKYWREIKIG